MAAAERSPARKSSQSGQSDGREQIGLSNVRTGTRPRALSAVGRAPVWAVVAVLAGATPAHAAGGLHLWPPDWMALGLILLAFVLLIVPVNRLVFVPLLRAMDEREDRIVGARRRGEKLEHDAEKVLERYERSVREAREAAELDRRSQIEKARGDHNALTAAARSEAEAEVERSRGEIQQSLEEARGALRASAEPLAREAAARILGRSLS